MYWSGVQSTGAEMRKYLTERRCQWTAEGQALSQFGRDLRLSTCCKATWASWGRLCWASFESMKVSGF